MNANDLIPNAFFTRNGKDPTCRLENLETKETADFGMSGLTAESYHRIIMPIEVEEE